ncbi:MAG TPA: lytic transglycosylase domain-containing protein [Candidatus Acidoferrum sp.]|nr:lytic transglycosylase domain-containing protein [Candidatus Acidoferrum sp.]
MKKSIQIGVCTLVAVVAMTALPCPAADTAVLRNGFSIRHERRQVMGLITRLFVDGDNSSFVDIPTMEIDHFEAAPDEPVSNVKAPPPPKPSDRPIDLNEVVRTASGNYQLDPDLVNSVIRAESGFNARAVSPKGAQGLMQLMPQTASQLGVQNSFDPRSNVEGGTRYLRELLERYNFDLIKALAAYNAGPQRVEQYGGVPPYYETKAYVARIVRDFNEKKLAAQAAASPTKKTAGTKSASKHVPPAKSQKSTQAKVTSAPAAESN